MRPSLAVNHSTNEAYLVWNQATFARDHEVEITKRPYTDSEIFDIRALGRFPAACAWKCYAISDQSLKFAQAMNKFDISYTFIGRPWLEETIYMQFRDLQLKLSRIPERSIESRVDGVKENSLALIIELVELLQELPHKSWRSTSKQPHNEANALEELIDVFFFVFNIAIAMRWTYADLIVTMAYKMKKNFNRVDEGYNKTD